MSGQNRTKAYVIVGIVAITTCIGLYFGVTKGAEFVQDVAAWEAIKDQHWKRCRMEEEAYSYAAQISSCTAIIDSPTADTAELAIAHFYRGDGYYGQEKYDTAIAEYSTAIAYDPKDKESYYSRGSAYHLKKNLDRAMQEYSAAIKLDAEYQAPLNERGTIYLQRKQWDAALADFQRSAKIDPESANMLFGRGIAQIRLGKESEGKADIAKAISLDDEMADNYKSYDLAP